MINILYAAADHANSKIQLSRFINHIDKSKYNIKIAAYKKSSPKNLEINWTLDCLYNMFTKRINLDNYYLDIYYNQIKSFSPDLIISDLEYFTTNIAHSLGIETWQCSSAALNQSINRKSKANINLFNNYSARLKKQGINSQIFTWMTENSSKNFIYSYFCDVENKPVLKKGFEWVRPYFVLGRESIVCKHDVVAATPNKSYSLMKFLSKYKDTVLFSDNKHNYKNIIYKDINNEDEFACNLFNCNFFISEGHGNFLADSFYNGIPTIILPDLFDNECIINSLLSYKYDICDVIYDPEDTFNLHDTSLHINDSVCFLHNKL